MTGPGFGLGNGGSRYISCADSVNRHIKPAIGRVPLAKPEPKHVRQMLDGMPGHLSSTTRRYTYVVLRNALGRAVKQQLVLRNVCELVDAPRKAKHEVEPFTQEEMRAFLASVEDDPLRALWHVAFASGARQGELLALRWDDVDFDAGTIHIRHTLARGTYELAEPKTASSKRVLELPPQTMAILREHRGTQMELSMMNRRKWVDLDLVFSTGNGTPLDHRNVVRYFQTATRRAGLKVRRFHDIRHTAATTMLARGVDMAVVSKALGHSNLATTVDIYAHWDRKMQGQTAAAMGAAAYA